MRAKHAVVLAAVLCLGVGATALAAQRAQGVVHDQTGLPVPGVTVALVHDEVVVITVVTADDGSFVLDPALPGEWVTAALDGFEPARVPRADASTIVLALARANETAIVTAPGGSPAAPSEAAIGGTLTAETIARLPSSHWKAKESLPMLPSVIRGPDGLMQLGGARAHETPLFLDGFNVTDPATGLSSINLPYESVRNVDALRDPMAITYGGLIAGVMKIDTNPGGDKLHMGVQGVVPRPRFASPGFGRLEGIFPRMYVSGPMAGTGHFFAAVEYDYERIPVPGVTHGRGPDIIEESGSFFARLDTVIGERQSITLDTLVYPSRTRSYALSPRREDAATPTIGAQDLFAGFTHRYVKSASSVITVQLGALVHDGTITPKGEGDALVTPAGFHGNWFASVNHNAVRYTVIATWQRVKMIANRHHDFTLSGEVQSRRLRGSLRERPVTVRNVSGQVVRTVEFASEGRLSAADRPLGLALRDVWDVSPRLQLDAGVRVDHSRYGGGRPSARVGASLALDAERVTVIKGGYGTFVGTIPLAVPAFGGYPSRVDRSVDPESGEVVTELAWQPVTGRIRFPHARAASIGVERQIGSGITAQVTLTDRQSHRLATLHVPEASGALEVSSTGRAEYREAQLAVRRAWQGGQQLFVSYVRSRATGELNDFTDQFRSLDAPLLQPGGIARLSSDARDRVLSWGTFNLPARVVISPVVEWHGGFRTSRLDERYRYAGTPNGHAFPAFMSADLVIYRTLTVKQRSADVGVQLFNATNHNNPRDVYPVAESPQYGRFVNSVGTILRGYVLVKW